MFFRGKRPSRLGVEDGRLADGPNKPNWVCSQTERSGHAIAPLAFSGDVQAAWARLRDVVLRMPRTELIDSSDDYMYFEFTSSLMRYVDDVEFYNDGRVFHVRSASRLGYSDLNANRKRVEAIRSEFES